MKLGRRLAMIFSQNILSIALRCRRDSKTHYRTSFRRFSSTAQQSQAHSYSQGLRQENMPPVVAVRIPTPLTVARLEDGSNGVPLGSHPLSFSKPSWVVRTESNVRKEVSKKPDPPCVVCQGTGRVDCYHCCGKGRTNYIHLAMLPKGVWPKWCRSCGGSGLNYCSRCLGTGEYRYKMGFQFMKIDSDDKKHQIRSNRGQQSAADWFLKGEQLDSEQA